MKLNRWKTIDTVNVRLEQLVKEDTKGCLIGYNVVDGDVKNITFAVQPVHVREDEGEFVEAEVRAPIVRYRHVVRLLVQVRLLVEIEDRGVVDINGGPDGPREFTLLFIRVGSGRKGTVAVDSLLGGFGHPLEIDGGL